MYPIDAPSLVHRETIGSRANDPILPDRPTRRARLRRLTSVTVRRLRRGPGAGEAARRGRVALID